MGEPFEAWVRRQGYDPEFFRELGDGRVIGMYPLISIDRPRWRVSVGDRTGWRDGY